MLGYFVSNQKQSAQSVCTQPQKALLRASRVAFCRAEPTDVFSAGAFGADVRPAQYITMYRTAHQLMVALSMAQLTT
jgi:hypothetical protein